LGYIWKTLAKSKNPNFEKMYTEIEDFKQTDSSMPPTWNNAIDDIKLVKHLDKHGFSHFPSDFTCTPDQAELWAMKICTIIYETKTPWV